MGSCLCCVRRKYYHRSSESGNIINFIFRFQTDGLGARALLDCSSAFGAPTSPRGLALELGYLSVEVLLEALIMVLLETKGSVLLSYGGRGNKSFAKEQGIYAGRATG